MSILKSWIGPAIIIILMLAGAIYLRNALISETVYYKNEKAGFSLTIPNKMNILEVSKEKTNGVTGGEVYFSYELIDTVRPVGLVVMYESPFIDGKGGACLDEEGNDAYAQESIAGQLVSVCRAEGFKAEYFKHPTKEIEYWIGTAGVTNASEIQEFEKIVKDTLKFE